MLYTLSVLHVMLELPLNHRTFAAIGRALAAPLRAPVAQPAPPSRQASPQVRPPRRSAPAEGAAIRRGLSTRRAIWWSDGRFALARRRRGHIMSYTLITANRNYSSWSLRPWVLMTALGIRFEDRLEPFAKPDNYDDFRAFSPTGQVPLLLDDERRVWDSLGITMYLADRHDRVWPAEAEARAFAQAIVAEMHGGFGALRNDCTMNVGVRVAPKPMSVALAPQRGAECAKSSRTGFDRFGGPWLAGAEFTAADAFYAPVAFRIRTYGLDVGRGAEWVERVIAHPAMQAWERQALAETWREESHEAELAAGGAVDGGLPAGVAGSSRASRRPCPPLPRRFAASLST